MKISQLEAHLANHKKRYGNQDVAIFLADEHGVQSNGFAPAVTTELRKGVDIPTNCAIFINMDEVIADLQRP